MKSFEFNIKNDNMVLTTNSPTAVSGGANYYKCAFTFDTTDWNGLNKFACFANSKAQLLDSNGECFIPEEAINEQGTIVIGVYGVPTDITDIENIGDYIRISTNIIPFKIGQGAYQDGFTSPEIPTADVWEEYIQQLKDINTEMLATKANLVNGKVAEGELPVYTMEEIVPSEGFAKSYTLIKDGVEIGATINVPKDLIITGSGGVLTVTETDVPYVGAVIGDAYIDLIVNNPDSSHLYIPVNKLVDIYTSGTGININASKQISINISTVVAGHILTVDSNGNIIDTAKKPSDYVEANNPITANITSRRFPTWDTKGLITGYTAPAHDKPIKVNGVIIATVLAGNSSELNIIVPTKTSQLTNDAGFLTQHQDISGKENSSNKVTAVDESSTDVQYPSAKCLYDLSLTKLSEPTKVVGSGTELTVADNSIYKLSDVSTLTITYPEGDFDTWIDITTASSGAITIMLPSTSTYIGDMPVFGNSESWELSIRNGRVIAGKAVSIV